MAAVRRFAVAFRGSAMAAWHLRRCGRAAAPTRGFACRRAALPALQGRAETLRACMLPKGSLRRPRCVEERRTRPCGSIASSASPYPRTAGGSTREEEKTSSPRSRARSSISACGQDCVPPTAAQIFKRRRLWGSWENLDHPSDPSGTLIDPGRRDAASAAAARGADRRATARDRPQDSRQRRAEEGESLGAPLQSRLECSARGRGDGGRDC